MSFHPGRFGIKASSSKNKSDKIPLINLDNLEEFINPGFLDSSNIQHEVEYTERADHILIKLCEEEKEPATNQHQELIQKDPATRNMIANSKLGNTHGETDILHRQHRLNKPLPRQQAE